MTNSVYLDKFNSTLEEFKKDLASLEFDLSSVFAENIKIELDTLNTYYQVCNEQGSDFVDKNAIVFEADKVFIEGVNLYQLWSNELDDEVQKSVWKYLNTLYLYSYGYVNKKELGELIGEYKEHKNSENLEVPKDKELIYSILSGMNQDKKIRKLEKKKEGETTSGGSLQDNIAKSIDHTAIGKLAKEIAGEINPEDFKDDLLKENPETLLSDLITGKLNENSGIMKLIGTIGSKLNDRMESGDLTQDTLLSEAQGIMGNTDLLNLGKSASGNPKKKKKSKKGGMNKKELEEKKRILREKQNKDDNLD